MRPTDTNYAPLMCERPAGEPPAFKGDWPAKPDMTLRDYFAAKAMEGMLAGGATVDISGAHIFENRARTCYALADAMLAERSR